MNNMYIGIDDDLSGKLLKITMFSREWIIEKNDSGITDETTPFGPWMKRRVFTTGAFDTRETTELKIKLELIDKEDGNDKS